MRKPVIGVMGGSAADEETLREADELGAAIASRGWVCLTGGRNEGVMAAASRGARRAGGLVIGLLPDLDDRRASPDLDVAVMTGMGDGRNLLNVLSSDVVVACRGRLGTLSEIVLALNHARPVITLGFPQGPLLAPERESGLLWEEASVEAVMARAERLLGRSAGG